jgi:hypothetical protein
MNAVMETSTVGKGRKYHVRIVKRDGMGQVADDYHATVMRLKDGAELVWIASWKWVLKLKIRRAALDRAFKSFDKNKMKLSEVEEFCA